MGSLMKLFPIETNQDFYFIAATLYTIESTEDRFYNPVRIYPETIDLVQILVANLSCY